MFLTPILGMLMKSYDVIVIGAGHNGLIVASKLAASGRRVLLLEAGDTTVEWRGVKFYLKVFKLQNWLVMQLVFQKM